MKADALRRRLLAVLREWCGPELRERFLRETRTAASFSHPNIVPVHAVEETPALLFFVMGYVEGETLTQRIRRQGPLPRYRKPTRCGCCRKSPGHSPTPTAAA